mgnify:FL=1
MSSKNSFFINHLRENGTIVSEKILGAFFFVDRKDFVPERYRNETYLDRPIPLNHEMTTSQPSTIAFMLEKLQPKVGWKVLEIGTGLGYLTALLAKIVGDNGQVVSVEYFADLKEFAQANLQKYSFKNIHLIVGDGKNGVSEEAPFDAIISSTEVHIIPLVWKKQLKTGGRLLTPVDSQIVLITKSSEKKFEEEKFPFFSFV